MKKIILSILLCGVVSFVSAQKMEKGSNLVSAGVGLFPGIGANFTYDHGLVDTWGPGLFTVGGFFGGSKRDRDSWGADFTERRWYIAPRATYRYNVMNELEVYGALMAGIRWYRYSYDSNIINVKSNETVFFIAPSIGCRYSFAPNFSAFAELGYNVNILNLGVNFSF